MRVFRCLISSLFLCYKCVKRSGCSSDGAMWHIIAAEFVGYLFLKFIIRSILKTCQWFIAQLLFMQYHSLLFGLVKKWCNKLYSELLHLYNPFFPISLQSASHSHTTLAAWHWFDHQKGYWRSRGLSHQTQKWELEYSVKYFQVKQNNVYGIIMRGLQI